MNLLSNACHHFPTSALSEMCHAALSTQLTPELHEVMDIATEQIVRPARGKSHPVQIDRNSYYNKTGPRRFQTGTARRVILILIMAATDRDKNLLRGGNEQLSCCHCLIQRLRSFRFLSANHAEKLKAEFR